MKITFIGTSAGEGYPGIWCECPNCTAARKLGGHNIRGNCCAMIDDDFLLDFNAHFVSMAPRLGISPSRLQGLLVTHPHIDHFAPEYLSQRAAFIKLDGLSFEQMQQHISPRFTSLPTLHIYGNAHVRKKLFAADSVMEQQQRNALDFHLVKDGVSIMQGDLTITPIRSQHTAIRGYTHNYIIERCGKTLLYACDTGGYDDDMLAIVLSKKYDCIIMEGTFGVGVDCDGHMSLARNRKMLRLFNEHNVWKNGMNFHLTHLCPHWTPPHDEYAAMLIEEGIEVAYDGKIIEF